MIPAGWRKVEWSQEAEAILGPVLADADEIAEGIERGSVELFEVGGDGYGGMLAVEMRRRIDGALVCWVHAYVGRGIMYGLADMEKLATDAGAVALVHQATKPALWRLYESLGWKCTDRFFERRLDGVE